MQVKPLGDRVLVKRIDPKEAEVVAVGDGKLDENGKRLPMSVKKGNRVLIGKYSGTDIKIDDDEHTILREDEILAIVVKK